jgi:hypothetical protein
MITTITNITQIIITEFWLLLTEDLKKYQKHG